MPSFPQQLRRLSIFQRIAVGNAAVIILGAVGGTILTLYLAESTTTPWLIVLFASVGIVISLVLNAWIIRRALQPLRDLADATLTRDLARLPPGERSALKSKLLEQGDADIRQLASTVAAYIDQLQAYNLQLKLLSEQAITAQEEERKRIARGLHDETGQALSLLVINLERLEDLVLASTAKQSPSPPELINKLTEIRQLAAQSLQDLRKVISGLRPTILDDLGLAPAIRWYARQTLTDAARSTSASPAAVTMEADLHLPPLSPEVTTNLFRIAQEAINNIARHAGAGSVLIRLTCLRGKLLLSIEDDGRGFDPASASSQAVQLRHWGLLGISERAGLVGGEILLDSKPGGGTRLQVLIPLPESSTIKPETTSA